MANWAKLQEDTHDMPVHKRARHGIHFKRSDGQIQAEFSGKPCHYLDGGLWKPIDTKLLVGGDGHYGCPHSPVRVHKDGHVRVDGSDYAQYVQLPSASGGLVDGDRIVRSFSFGQQVLRVTENGFRSEIILNRVPTLSEARKLVATESGTLPVQYLKLLTTATDANGNEHTFTTLSAFRTWLASAVFPVTVDPDLITSEAGGDTEIRANTTNFGTTPTIGIVSSRLAILRFILSSISSSATCTAATVTLTLSTGTFAAGSTLYKITDANGDWTETGCSGNYKINASTTAWAGSAMLGTADTDYDSTVIVTTSETSPGCVYTFNAAGLAVLQSWFGDASNNGLFNKTSAGSYAFYHTSEAASESNRPTMSVTYTAGASTHFMSLLGVGS